MANIFFGLNIGRSALLANQAAIDVTGHNLANVQTEGYSRQRVTLAPSLPIQTAQGPVGSGVSFEGVQRIQLSYLDRQINLVESQHGYDDALVTGLDQLQAVLGEPSSDGLSGALTEFWNSWEALSARPSDAALRAQVIDRAEQLVATYNEKMTAISESASSFGQLLESDLSDVNAWAEQIASLNGEIAKSEAAGYSPNDLKDQRDLLVRQVAEKLGVETEIDGPYVNLRFPDNGPYLVYQGQTTGELTSVRDDSAQITGFLLGSTPVTVSGGEIGALNDLQGEIAPDLQRQLADLMGTVAESVNSFHTSGYDQDGQPGLNFFVWSGTGDSVTFASTSELQQVTPGAGLEPGTHYLEVTAVDAALAPNTAGDLPASGPGSISLAATGTYSGPMTLNLDYHVRVISAGNDPTSLDGMRVQLYRGDEPVGDVLDLSTAAPPYQWTGVDGLTFTATITPGTLFPAGGRSDGLSTTGYVSLDGGPPQPVGITSPNHISFDAGNDSGYLGGSATVDFTLEPFSGASFTVYGAGATLSVNPLVAADQGKIAAAGPSESGGAGAEGTGENARLIASLASQGIFEQTGETAAGQLGLIVESLGSKARDAGTFESASGSILAQLTTQRESASGVNLDEEMVQLIQFQRGFEAAAQFLTTVDEMIDTLINRVGAR
ncbi:MAG: flagellar hook-associated protein FlgK [Deltaproteobacteria bacterium]|nr:flagellar hook-associated protein FlgK [Deltaproteobacteria bacterium]